MKDVTNELTELERGLLFYNCENGVMIGGRCGDGVGYHRRFSSETMQSGSYPDEVFVRTGEVFKDEFDNFVVVYRLKQ